MHREASAPVTIKVMPGASTAARVSRGGDLAKRFFDWSLLGMLASGYFAVLGSGQLDLPTAVVMFAALAARAMILAGSVEITIPSKLVSALAILYIVYFPVDYFLLSGEFLPALTHMIFFVAVMKLLTSTTTRDHMYLVVIATLELLAAAILSTDPTFFLFLATFLLSGIGAFAAGEILKASARGRTVVRKVEGEEKVLLGQRQTQAGTVGFSRRLFFLSTTLFVAILVLTGAMFFVLPRTARAALQRFVPERYHLPGFSNEVTLGEIGEIKQSSAPVMHVHSETDQLAGLHWRGSALESFDGKRWFNPSSQDTRIRVENGEVTLDPIPADRPGRSIQYEVELDEIAPDTLLFAGTPQTISIETGGLWLTDVGALRAPRLRVNGLRYAAYSFLEDPFDNRPRRVEPLSSSERAVLLALPPIDRRIYQLAGEWTQGQITPETKARAMEQHLRNDFGYTLQLLPESVADPLANFLFERREGHCEYFASALAVMLRTEGIPARVATGFLGGVYNPMTGYQVIRAADAHSWVEAWIDGRGWVTLDPTPPDPNAAVDGGFSRIAMFLDAANQYWRDWVVGYDFEHQVVLASRMQEASRHLNFSLPEDWFGEWPMLRGLGGWTGGLAVLVMLGAVGFVAGWYGPSVWRELRSQIRLYRAKSGHGNASDATQIYQRMLVLLERRGYTKPSWLTADEFARVLPPGDLHLLVGDMTAAYNEVRFGGRQDVAPRMARLLSRIEDVGKRAHA